MRKWKISYVPQSGKRGGHTAESSNSLYLTFIFRAIKIFVERKLKDTSLAFAKINYNNLHVSRSFRTAEVITVILDGVLSIIIKSVLQI